MATSRIPSLLKHCALAIFQDKSIQGSSPKERFQSALNIAKARLVEYGFLTKGSEDRPADKVQLTPKGAQRERTHKREGPAKNKAFDQLYKLIEREESGARTEAVAEPTVARRRR